MKPKLATCRAETGPGLRGPNKPPHPASTLIELLTIIAITDCHTAIRRAILPILLVISLNAAAAEPRRVLLIHSFGQDFQPFTTFSADFRSGLVRQSPQTVDFFDVALAGARFESHEESALVDYLGALFASHRLDLVVPMGAPAVRFAQKHRSRLFPDTPMILASVEQRMVQTSSLTTNDAVIAVRHEPRLLIEAILRLMPGTTNVAFVFGGSQLERFWANEFIREGQLPTNHVGCESFSPLCFEQMKQRAASLPPGSVMLFGDLLVDADGIPLTGDDPLAKLHAVANAPIFGIHDLQLGHGIVGGPLVPVRELARQSASAAARILKGESPACFRPPPLGATVPTYDWRELRRWNIGQERLPTGSVIMYRTPTVWERHRFAILTGASALVAQAVLIACLVLNQRRRRKAEHSLRESEERMKLAAGAAQLGMWEWDVVSDKVFVMAQSPNPVETQSDLPSNYDSFISTVHPEDRDGVTQALAKAMAGDGNYEHTNRQLLPDGQVRWISARARVQFDAEHRPVKIRGVGMDITARKLAEEQARESEKQFLLIANSAPVMIWTSGPDKLCTFANQAWLELRGRTLEQELGNGWAEGLHPEDLEHSLKVYTESFDARQPFSMEYRLLRHDGQYRWVTAHGVPRYDTQKQFLGYIGSCVDVTEKKEAESELQRSQLELNHVSRVSTIGALAGSLAHELNQPLAAVVINAEAAQQLMAGERTNDREVCDTLKDIVEQGQRAGEIIAGMRAMLKKDSGKSAALNLNVVVSRVLEMVRGLLQARRVSLVLQLDPLLPSVKGHDIQLRQVVLNLLNNACDAMSRIPPERRKLTVKSRCVTPNKVEVSVADNGPGFPPEMLQHPFEPFRTTKSDGLGLGLAICQSIIAAHSGKLVAANNPDEGATVRFTLPAQNPIGPLNQDQASV